MIQNLAANYLHYNSLGNQTELEPFFRTSSQLRIFDKPATITAKDIVADDIESEIIWQVSAKVVSVNIPGYYPFTNLINTVFKCSYLNDLVSVLRFTTQPLTQSAAAGGDVTLTGVAAGGTGTKTYQWEVFNKWFNI